MIGKLICWITRKHKRGVRVSPKEQEGFAEYQCPRCGAKWARAAKKARA